MWETLSNRERETVVASLRSDNTGGDLQILADT